MNILIIEDDKELRDLFKEKFEEYGLIVFPAENGEVGLEILAHESIDFVLTDVQMPVMSGMDFLRNARKIKKQLPPIFIMTGGCQYTKKQFYDEGAAGFFEKTDVSIEEVIGYSKKYA